MGLADKPIETIQGLGPRRTVVNGDTVETHSMADVIAWDKYAEKRLRSSNPMLRIWRSKFVIPGPVSRLESPECPS